MQFAIEIKRKSYLAPFPSYRRVEVELSLLTGGVRASL